MRTAKEARLMEPADVEQATGAVEVSFDKRRKAHARKHVILPCQGCGYEGERNPFETCPKCGRRPVDFERIGEEVREEDGDIGVGDL